MQAEITSISRNPIKKKQRGGREREGEKRKKKKKKKNESRVIMHSSSLNCLAQRIIQWE